MKPLTHKQLLDIYQEELEYINRRLQPDCLEFYKESADTWKHTKDIAFNMYQSLRYYVEGGVPTYEDIKYQDMPDTPSYEGNKAIGIVNYRGTDYIIYNDDYGMSEFIIVNGKHIMIDSCSSGPTDWWYEVDRILDLN